MPKTKTAAAVKLELVKDEQREFENVLEVLADLLIENAERDGTIPSRRPAD